MNTEDTVDKFYTIKENESQKPKFLEPQFIVTGCSVLAGIAIIVWLFFSFTKPSKDVRQAKVEARTPTSIQLVSTKTQYQVGDLIPVKIDVSSNKGKTSGIDIALKFSGSLVEATSSGIVVNEKMFPEFPLKQIDSESSEVLLSGISSEKDSGFLGNESLATIFFVAKKPGNASFELEFTPGFTSDTNIVSADSGDDLLETVQNLNIEIR